AFEVPLIGIVTSSLAGASFGLFTQYCKDQNFAMANSLFNRIASVASLIIFPCFAILFYSATDVVITLFSDSYIESTFFFRVYLLLLPIRIIQYGNVMIALGKSNVLLFRSIIELLISATLSFGLFFIFNYKGIVFGLFFSCF